MSDLHQQAADKNLTLDFGQWKIENAVCVEFDQAGEPLYQGGGVPGHRTKKELAKYMLESIYDLNPKILLKAAGGSD